MCPSGPQDARGVMTHALSVCAFLAASPSLPRCPPCPTTSSFLRIEPPSRNDPVAHPARSVRTFTHVSLPPSTAISSVLSLFLVTCFVAYGLSFTHANSHYNIFPSRHSTSTAYRSPPSVCSPFSPVLSSPSFLHAIRTHARGVRGVVFASLDVLYTCIQYSRERLKCIKGY